MGGRPALWLPSGELLDLAAGGTLSSARWRPQSVVSVLAEGEEGLARLERLRAELDSASDEDRARWRASGALLPYAGTQLLAPVRRPGLLLMQPDAATPAYIKNPNAALGPNAEIGWPDDRAEQLAAVAMPALVLGRPLFQAGADQTARALGALTLVVDLGIGATPASTADRQFPGACPIGPALITLDEVRQRPLSLEVAVNGHRVATCRLERWLAEAAGQVASLSRRYAFRPGDIIATHAGATPRILARGDQVTVALAGMMELKFSLA